jgi:divalent metal cation (Fe/Co/Zn/Cd) transporter
VRTRQSGIRRFVSFHVLVPGKWTIQEGHNLMEKIEADLRDKIPHVTTTIHIEPLEDPKSHDDTFIAS